MFLHTIPLQINAVALSYLYLFHAFPCYAIIPAVINMHPLTCSSTSFQISPGAPQSISSGALAKRSRHGLTSGNVTVIGGP